MVRREQVELASPLAPKRRGQRMPVPQRFRLMALRLDAGMRETPQRFLPLAHHVAGSDPQTRHGLLRFLVEAVAREAAASPACSPDVRALVARAHDVVTDVSPGAEDRWSTLADAIFSVEDSRRRRRHVHCHGAVTADRRLLFLRSLIFVIEAKDPIALELWRLIAYAMSDYDQDHFVLQGAHLAVRVRALADWVEREMLRATAGE